MMRMGVKKPGWILSCGVACAVLASAASGQEPPVPTDLPVLEIGGPEIDGSRLQPYEGVRFTLGGDAKDGPLDFGERVNAAAYQVMSLRAAEDHGREVWVRTAETFRAGESTAVAKGEITLDKWTLRPIRSRVSNAGSVSSFEYDWEKGVLRHTNESDGTVTEEALDMAMVEAGAHETWVASVDWGAYDRSMIPAVLAGGGGQWWAVPRVVGTEAIDIGDGIRRDAWVIEMDWWGRGIDGASFTPGGGVNDTAGTGGKYWVLHDPPEGVPGMVRVRTEANADMDRVNQMQDGVGG